MILFFGLLGWEIADLDFLVLNWSRVYGVLFSLVIWFSWWIFTIASVFTDGIDV